MYQDAIGIAGSKRLRVGASGEDDVDNGVCFDGIECE